MEILPGIHQIQVPIPNNPLGYLNTYLIEGKDGWLMIDTGWFTPNSFNYLESRIRDLDLTLSDISRIILTHAHPDHFSLSVKIKQCSPGTELLAHRWEAELIESRYIKFSELHNKMSTMLESHGVPKTEILMSNSPPIPALRFEKVPLPDRHLYGGEIIKTGLYDLEVIWTPGHSPGHICLFELKNRFLFSGDHILPSITPNVSSHIQSGDNPLGDYLYALKKLRNLKVAMILPAHGEVFYDLKGRIDEIINHHSERQAEISQVIEEEPRNAYEVSSLITWNVPGLAWEQFPPLQKRFALTETIAHLELMRWEGRLKKMIRGNLISYAPV